MKNVLDKRYGLFTAICMVVGIVIGSGVFFKSQDILADVNGNVGLGTLAWIVGGIVMMICAFNFANFATKHAKVNGLVDYAEAIVGEKYAYFLGWFATAIYYPAMTSVLAWVSARYTLVLFGSTEITGGLCMTLACLYLVAIYVLNTLAPKLAGKLQVSATVVKLIPLGLMMVVGLIAGLINGNTVEAFTATAQTDSSGLFGGIVAAAFAYEGWIISTSINAELKNPKKDLPKALLIGTAIIMIVYVVYFIGVTGGATVDEIVNAGSPRAFVNLFGRVGGTVLNAFVVVSCLGTLNGLMMACSRSAYSLAVRGVGPKPDTFGELSEATNTPVNSGVFGLLICALWLFYFYAANLTEPLFGVFSFDSSELPIVTTYALYIPIFAIYMIKNRKSGNVWKDIVMPILAILASLFMIFCAVYGHGIVPYLAAKQKGEFAFPVLFYLIVFAVIMTVGMLLYKPKGKKQPLLQENETQAEQE